MAAIDYQYQDGGFVRVPDDCPDCGEPLYDSGCDAPGCLGRGCQGCGWGCDLDFAGDLSDCAAAIEAESPDVRDARVDAERAAYGLPPVSDTTENTGAAYLDVTREAIEVVADREASR